ncbi:MAG: DUF3891 family protein [Abditibacteriales bacterium]|nr:DUF3891 family protein [Abditibacteriales bacterium]
MIRREWKGQLLLIPQTAHAQLAGKLAGQWGNDEFLSPEPRLEVILATSQHDNGWEAWERAPQLNPRTGLPYHFTEMPISEHLRIWRDSVERMRKQNAYAALLVSLHGAALYAHGLDPARDSPEAREQVREFLNEQLKVQQALRWELEQAYPPPPPTGHGLESISHPEEEEDEPPTRREELYHRWITEPHVNLNFRLLQVWDWLSLLLCCFPLTERVIPQVPRRDDPASWVEMKLIPRGEDTFTLDPYPFRAPQFRLTVSGRRLPLGTFETQEKFLSAYRAAPIQQLTFVVRDG